MSLLCEMEATGAFGWADIAMWLFCSWLVGCFAGAFAWRWAHRYAGAR
jgi:hypothetical protein